MFKISLKLLKFIRKEQVKESKTEFIFGKKENVKTIFKGQVNCFEPKTYSSFKRLKRVRAWVKRFVDNCRSSVDCREIQELNVEEIEDQEIQIIKENQEHEFKEEIKCLKKGHRLSTTSSIRKLNPIMDEDGLLRGNTRIINAEFLDFSIRYPILLSENSWISWLIVTEIHNDKRHCAGTQHMLNELMKRFWLPKARVMIQREIGRAHV